MQDVLTPGVKLVLYFSLCIYLLLAALISKELEDATVTGRRRVIAMLGLLAEAASFLSTCFLVFTGINPAHYYVQLAQVSLSTPLVVIALAQLGGLSAGATFSIATMDLLFFFSLWLASGLDELKKWIAFGAGLVFLAAFLTLLWTQAAERVESFFEHPQYQQEPQASQKVPVGRHARLWYFRLCVWIGLLWSAYAGVWMLSDGGICDEIPVNLRVVIYLVLDLLSTALTCILIVFIAQPPIKKTYIEII